MAHSQRSPLGLYKLRFRTKHFLNGNKPKFNRNFGLRLNLSTAALNDEMKCWETEDYNGIKDIKISSMKFPLITKPSEAVIKVSAASVNPIDTAILEGYGKNLLQVMKVADKFSTGKCDTDAPQFPLTVGRDFVGKVVSVGQSVSNVKVGDCVWGVVSPHSKGSHATYVVTESSNVTLKPKSLTDIEGASIPYAGLTSWSAAVVTGGLTPNKCDGKQILILGVSGGVGTFISQLLTAWGAEVTGVCSEDAFELAYSCGASELYDYRDPDTLLKLISHPRFDVIIDAAGTNDSKWANGLKEWTNASYITLRSPLLRNTDQNGLLVGLFATVMDLLKQNTTTLPKGRLCKWAYFMPNENALKEIAKLVEDKKIRPVIDKVFKFEDGKSAYEHVRNGSNRGKTVIDFSL